MSYRIVLPVLVAVLALAGPAQAQTRVHNRNVYDVWVATGLYKENAFPLGPMGPPHALESKGWLRIPADNSVLIEATHLLAITRKLDGSIVPLNPRPSTKDPVRVFYYKDHPNLFSRVFADNPQLIAQIKAIGGLAREYAPLNWFANPDTGDFEIVGPRLPAVTERYAIGLFNATELPQQVRFRWDPNKEWDRFTLAPGKARLLDNVDFGQPEIEYDFSPAPGFQERARRLEAGGVLLAVGKEPVWRDAARYVFFPRGGESVLLPYLPIDFPNIGKDRPGDGLDGFVVDLQPREERIYKIEFTGGQQAQVVVQGRGLTDIDLFILDGKKEVRRDDRPGDNCQCSWTPKATAVYLVKVQNLDFTKANRILIQHNGTVQSGGAVISFLPGKDDQPGPKTPAVTINFNQAVNLLPKSDVTLNVNLKAKVETTITAKGQGTTRVEMIILMPDGRTIAAENTGNDQCQATFTPPVSGQYRIRLRNVGDQLNQVRVTAK